MNWFKDLFIRKDSQPERIPAIPKREPNISEPVISFVETFKANPQRFKIKKKGPATRYGHWDTVWYELTDKKANLSWPFSFTIYNQPMLIGCHYPPNPTFPDFLTRDEFTYIEDNLRKFFYNRSCKLSEMRLERKKREANKEREALKKVYCK